MKYIAGNIGISNDEDLAECVSDSLLAIWNRINRYNGEKTSFKAWIVLVTRGCAIDFIRKSKKHRHVAYLEDLNRESLIDESFDTNSAEDLCELLNRLAPPDNDIFYRRFILGEAIPEISKALGISAEGIYKRITRGRIKFKALLAEEGYNV